MRLFAVGSWDTFGSMVISICLLGFGLAGTLLTLVQKRVLANPDAWLFATSFLMAPAMALSQILAQQVPFNPVLIVSDSMQLWWIAAYYAIYAVPFFFGALFIGVIFMTLSGRIHQLYFWNMLGSGRRRLRRPPLDVPAASREAHPPPSCVVFSRDPLLRRELERQPGRTLPPAQDGLL